MELIPDFDMGDIHRHLEGEVAKIKKAIIAYLRRNGEQWVTECKTQDGSGKKPYYRDRTANLRSSIGFFIKDGGQIVFEQYHGTPEGQRKSKALAKNFKGGADEIILVGVAGMNYAAALEAKGYNVIMNQVLQIIPMIKGDMEELERKVNGR